MKHKGTVMLETERLILRKFTENDAEAVFWNWASDDKVTKHLTWPTHRSVENSAGYIDFCLETYKENNAYQELLCRGWFLPPNTYDCGSFVVN